jgi:hypothetical protein
MSESEGKPEELERTQEDRGRGELVAEDKGATKVSIFAIAAVISAAAMFLMFVLLVVLCRCGLDPEDLEFAFAFFTLVFFWLLAGVLGVAAIVDITSDGKRLKGFSLAVSAIIVFFSAWLVPQILRGPPPNELGNLCSATLHQLSLAMKEYTDAHDGHLPAADKWCDLLMKHCGLPRKDFRCPGAKADTGGYAFNRNLDGLHLYRDVHKPGHVVLLFDAEGGWNLSGGEELLKMRHRGMKGKRCNLLFADFSVKSYDDEDFEKEPLRWKPEGDL